MSTAAPRLSTCSGRFSWSANMERRPSGASNREGQEARGGDGDERGHDRQGVGRPRRRHRCATAIGNSTAGQSFAAKPRPSRAPLATGRSRTIATRAPTASSVGQRSKRVSKREPSTTGETPIRSSAAQVRSVLASTARSAHAAATMQAAPQTPISTANDVA